MLAEELRRQAHQPAADRITALLNWAQRLWACCRADADPMRSGFLPD